MKKFIVFTIAALSIAGQIQVAEAAGAFRPAPRKAPEYRKTVRTEGQAKAGGAKVLKGADAAIAKVQNLPEAGKLSQQQVRDLREQLATDERVLKRFNEIETQLDKAEFAELNPAIIEGLSNLKGLEGDKNAQPGIAAMDVKPLAEQAYINIVLRGDVSGWSKSTLGTFTKFMTDVNLAARSKSIDVAMYETTREFLKSQGKPHGDKEIREFLENLKTYCKL